MSDDTKLENKRCVDRLEAIAQWYDKSAIEMRELLGPNGMECFLDYTEKAALYRNAAFAIKLQVTS